MNDFMPDSRLSYEAAERRDDRMQGILALAVAVVIGLIAAGAAAVLGEKLKLTRLILLPVLVPFVVISVQLGILRQAVLFGWVFALTYSRNYYLFSKSGEWQGLYWIPSDIPFIALVVLWLVEGFFRKQIAYRSFGLAWVAIVPWIAVDLISLTVADRPDWVLWDLVKLVRGFAILLVIPAMLSPRDWWVCLWGLGFAATVQSLIGGSQVVLRRSAYVLEGESMVRAAGTMMHPNLLAAFLLVSVPVFVTLAIGSRNFWTRWISMGIGLIGVAGLAATMSRTPVVLLAALVGVMVLILLVRGLITSKQVIATSALVILALAAVALPLSGKIYERITKNWKESVDFRSEANAQAYKLFEKNQLLGIGPTHYTVHMIKENRAYRKLYKDNVEDAKVTNVRYMLAVHNAYLLVLAEVGLLGFSALLFLIVYSLGLGLRAITTTSGDWQLVSLGLTLGLLGMFGQGLTEYALVMEQDFYPMLLVVALLSRVPALARETTPEPRL